MRVRLSAPLLLLSAVSSIAASQAPPATPAPATTPHITVTTHLVTVDVVVRAHDQPVRGLTRADFTVLEDGHPQTLNFFEPHTAADNAAPATTPRLPSLPPDTYTNLPITQVTDSVTVLLLDGLNTEAADQLFVRREMIRYLKELPPGRRIAVFTLGTQLRLLQGFTDDVTLLLAALDRKEAATPSTMTIPKSQIADERNALDWMAEVGASPMLVDSYTNFVNKSDANETNQRIALTVEAMEQLARQRRPPLCHRSARRCSRRRVSRGRPRCPACKHIRGRAAGRLRPHHQWYRRAQSLAGHRHARSAQAVRNAGITRKRIVGLSFVGERKG